MKKRHYVIMFLDVVITTTCLTFNCLQREKYIAIYLYAMCESSDEETCISASEYFLSAARKLCLGDFPHGFGKWRLSSMDFSVDVRRAIEKITNYYENVDDLVDLIKDVHSPWNCSNKWSDDICSLKEIAVRHPEVLWRKDFLWKHFRNLIFQDKNISEIDANVAKLINLQSLILSVNNIRSLNINHLPACLQHLELFGNKISIIVEPQNSPPKILMHLGLGQNCLGSLDNCLASSLWPCLTSLDLCLNNLVDIAVLCCKLKELPNLRSLYAFGNPLSYVPVFRGYIIDAVPQLSHLDGVKISAMERKYARGLKDKDCRDAELHEGKILVEVLQVNGLPSPEGIEYPGRRCFVRYSFINQCIPTHRISTFAATNDGNSEQKYDSKDSTEDDHRVTKNVDFNEDDFYVTRSYDWKDNIEVRESVVVRFQNLSELKKRLFGNLLVEVVEERITPSEKASVQDETSKTNKKKTPQKKQSTKNLAESKSTIESKEKEVEVKAERRHLQIFSLPLSGLLGKCPRLDLQLKKKLLFDVPVAPKASTFRPDTSNKPKTGKKSEKKTTKAKMEPQERQSESDIRRTIYGILELNIRIEVVRTC